MRLCIVALWSHASLGGSGGDTVESLGLERKERLWCSHGISQEMRN